MSTRNFFRTLLGIGIFALAVPLVFSQPGSEKKADKPATDKKIVAMFSDIYNPAHANHKANLNFARLVEEKTKGMLTIKVVPSGQLGATRESIENTISGAIQFCGLNNAVLGTFEPSRMIFDLPFIFRNNEHMAKAVDGPVGQETRATVEKKLGVRIIMDGMFDGPRIVYTRVKPINKPEDFAGLKIRTMESPLMIDTFKAVGANPTPMAATEVYMGLKQGTIDAAENSPQVILSERMYEATKYLSQTNHLNIPVLNIVNVAWLKSLPEAYQTAIDEGQKEAIAQQRATWVKAIADATEELKKLGMTVNAVDPTPFQGKMEAVWAKYAEKIGGMAQIKRVLDTQ